MMDPQQRLLLQHAWKALATLPTAEGSLTSVAIGIGTVEYTALSAHMGSSIFTATGAPRLTILFAAAMHCIAAAGARSQGTAAPLLTPLASSCSSHVDVYRSACTCTHAYCSAQAGPSVAHSAYAAPNWPPSVPSQYTSCWSKPVRGPAGACRRGHERGSRAHLVPVWAEGQLREPGHGLLLVPGGHPPGCQGPAAGHCCSRPGRRRQPHPQRQQDRSLRCDRRASLAHQYQRLHTPQPGSWPGHCCGESPLQASCWDAIDYCVRALNICSHYAWVNRRGSGACGCRHACA